MRTVRFIHTADWQLGMTRHFLGPEAQARFTAARAEAVRSIGALARDLDCAFVVVCGDVFESNHIDRQVLVRALDAMRGVPVPVYLLPGNHDPLDAGSVYRWATFREHAPDHVHVLESFDPVEAAPGLWLLPAPWSSKRPLEDLVARAVGGLSRSEEASDSTGSAGMDAPAETAASAAEPRESAAVNLLVGHGIVDVLSPDAADPALISLRGLESVISSGKLDYAALGDRHSVTDVGSTGRIWYSGAPEATDYDEVDAGAVLLVELPVGGDGLPAGGDGLPAGGDRSPSVERHQIGQWRFVREVYSVNSADDIERLAVELDAREAKERTVLKLGFVGSLSLRDKARLDELLEHNRDLYAGLQVWRRKTELAVLPEDADFDGLGLSGFAADALEELRAAAADPGVDGATAQDALALLVRLAGSHSE